MNKAAKATESHLGDMPAAEFRRRLHELADWVGDYREDIAGRPISRNVRPGEILSELDRDPPETGTSFDEIFADIDRVIVPGIAHWAHPEFLSYFGCTTTSPGILAEMITGALNVNTMTWRTAPAGTELETLVLEWLRQWLCLPNEFKGVVYDTASISTMHALATAREAVAPNTRQLGLSGRGLPRFRIYTSDQAHSSIEKGAIAIGIGEENVRRVPVDSEFRIDIAALREAIAQDRQQGFHPMAVVATVTAGWSEADSIVVNPHKMLFVPFDFSALYLRDITQLRRLFMLVPEYLHLRDPVGAEINYMDYGVQLGRRFRALKAWVVWRAFGRAGIAARIRDHLRLARLFAEWVRDDKRFELAAPVMMGVVCFRFIGAAPAAIDALNTEIVERINASGRAYLTQTKLHGHTAMRVGLGNVLTTEEHVRDAWLLIQQTVKAV
jgi:aromatic-L-amino-acid decarboxylase